MALAGPQGGMIAPELLQNLQAVDQAVALARQTLQGAVNLIVRHDQSFDWSAIRERMQHQAQRAER